jgi:hypothetical protein
MISYRQADIKSRIFPANIIGKRLIFFPCAFHAKMGFTILDWQDGRVLRENTDIGSYEAHSLGKDTTSPKVWSDPVYKREDFFGVRDDMAFFQNSSKSPIIGHEIVIDLYKTGREKITELTSDGYVVTDKGTRIKPEEWSFGIMQTGAWQLKRVKP